mgnify:CR=1 FL=1
MLKDSILFDFFQVWFKIMHTIKEQTFCVVCPSNYALILFVAIFSAILVGGRAVKGKW